jgi:phosphoglycerate dehydrogenase-like enzyme
MPDTGKIVVASQMGQVLDALMQAQLPQIEVRSVSRGGPRLDADVQVLFAAFFPGSPSTWEALRPEGWPFNLKWVQLISAGTDQYPRWLFELPVATARGTSAHPVSELALAAILSVAKQLDRLWVHSPVDWQHRPLSTIFGSTIGVVGYGAIGSLVASKAIALGMKVKVYRRSKASIEIPGIELVHSLEALFEVSDHVVVIAPANDETRHLINAKVLAHAKPGLHLVNIARGSLLDQEALLQALDRGRLGWATLDVTDPEPLPAGHLLYTHPRVRISPHTAAVSDYTHHAMFEKFGQNLARFTAGHELIDQVVRPRT